MKYLNTTPNPSGAYPAPQGHYAKGTIPLTDEQTAMVGEYNGFVTITPETDEAGAVSYKVEPNTEAWEAWKKSLPEPEPGASEYIPTPEQSAVVMMRAAFNQQVSTMEDDLIIQCSGLADTWTPGDHKVGEIYNAGDQTWECYQAYNNEVYPGVKPGDPSWYTFNRPLHGKSPETARPFVPVQGSHDMYRTGEYMVYTDGKTYRCKSDTNFSPDDYAQAWEVAA